MDAFFASVELLRHPELRGKPLVVGGAGPRGVVAAASYEARRFGVHSSMPLFQARRLCPEGAFLRCRMDRYKEASRQVMAILGHVSPLVEQASIDEAYVEFAEPEADYTLARRLDEFPNVAVCRTFSKAYGLAGLRLGYGLLPPAVDSTRSR